MSSRKEAIFVNKKVKTKELFSTDCPFLKDLFEKSEYPWQILPEIKGLCAKLIENGIEGYHCNIRRREVLQRPPLQTSREEDSGHSKEDVLLREGLGGICKVQTEAVSRLPALEERAQGGKI